MGSSLAKIVFAKSADSPSYALTRSLWVNVQLNIVIKCGRGQIEKKATVVIKSVTKFSSKLVYKYVYGVATTQGLDSP